MGTRSHRFDRSHLISRPLQLSDKAKATAAVVIFGGLIALGHLYSWWAATQ